MRLINTATLQLHDFLDSHIPLSYAILSHTWGAEEISLHEWRAIELKRDQDNDFANLLALSLQFGAWTQHTERKAGYRKVVDFCNICLRDGYEWAWVDTTCIDKTSSAELSEAINSMFRWYRKAARCYALLTDVEDKSVIVDTVSEDGSSTSSGSRSDESDNEVDLMKQSYWEEHPPPDVSSIEWEQHKKSGFMSSRWFTRGWTLQELIAPPTVRFYDRNWQLIGTRYKLARVIEEITKIPCKVLTCPYGDTFLEYPVAEIMSWASKRQTSRVEDIAYSLLGLFRISMPLLYGEGQNAFKRLQEEIIKRTTDHSIFAWFLSSKSALLYGGILAESPKAFSGCGKLFSTCKSRYSDNNSAGQKSYLLTNRGLHIELPMTETMDCTLCQGWADSKLVGCRLAILNCWTAGSDNKRVSIHLAPESGMDGVLQRVHCGIITTCGPVDINISSLSRQHVYIKA